MVTTDDPLPELSHGEPTETEKRIGEIIAANLVDDGATIQMGIGNIPAHVLSCLWSHRDIGVHTEMFSDGLVDLVEKGVITNSMKKIHQGRIVGGFCFGTKKLYDFLHNNPFVGR